MKRQLYAGLTALTLLTACTTKANTPTANSSNSSVTTTTDLTSLSSTSLKKDVSDVDVDTSWDEQTATKITLNTSYVEIEGAGATVSNNTTVTISDEGTYLISGTLQDGQILIAATNQDQVHLIFNGLEITNTTGAAIYSSQCDKLVITLVEGTVNTLTDGKSNFHFVDSINEEPNAALFSKDDLTINGQGSLTINAGFNNGIGSKDDLVIVSGTIQVNATQNGLRGNDSVLILDGKLSIQAGNDGIQSHTTDDETCGWIQIEGGVVDITSGHDAIQAATSLTLLNGEISTLTSETTVDTTEEVTASYKGLKATKDIIILDGSYSLVSEDDAIHSNQNITIQGGNFVISTQDDGIHADQTCTVSGGSIEVTNSYEGLEASNLIITSGMIKVVSSDDGLNAAGGNDSSSTQGRFGHDQFTSTSDNSIQILGGEITVEAGGDGFDSNGTISIQGGTIISLIQSSLDNEAMDCDGALEITGGTIIYGGSETGGELSETSTQSYLAIQSEVQAAHTLTIKQDEETLFTFTPSFSCQKLVISTQQLIEGESYDVVVDDIITTLVAGTGNTSNFGGYGGGLNRGEKPSGNLNEERPQRGNGTVPLQEPTDSNLAPAAKSTPLTTQ